MHSVERQEIHMKLEPRGKRARLKDTVYPGDRGLELLEGNKQRTCGEEGVVPTSIDVPSCAVPWYIP